MERKKCGLYLTACTVYLMNINNKVQTSKSEFLRPAFQHVRTITTFQKVPRLKTLFNEDLKLCVGAKPLFVPKNSSEKSILKQADHADIN